jgi:hypothetical protein
MNSIRHEQIQDFICFAMDFGIQIDTFIESKLVLKFKNNEHTFIKFQNYWTTKSPEMQKVIMNFNEAGGICFAAIIYSHLFCEKNGKTVQRQIESEKDAEILCIAIGADIMQHLTLIE